MRQRIHEIKSYLSKRLFYSALTNDGLIAVNSHGVLVRVNIKRLKIEWTDEQGIPRYLIVRGRPSADSVRTALASCERSMAYA